MELQFYIAYILVLLTTSQLRRLGRLFAAGFSKEVRKLCGKKGHQQFPTKAWNVEWPQEFCIIKTISLHVGAFNIPPPPKKKKKKGRKEGKKERWKERKEGHNAKTERKKGRKPRKKERKKEN